MVSGMLKEKLGTTWRTQQQLGLDDADAKELIQEAVLILVADTGLRVRSVVEAQRGQD